MGNIDNTYRYTHGNTQFLQMQPTKTLQQIVSKQSKSDNIDFSVTISTKVLKQLLCPIVKQKNEQYFYIKFENNTLYFINSSDNEHFKSCIIKIELQP